MFLSIFFFHMNLLDFYLYVSENPVGKKTKLDLLYPSKQAFISIENNLMFWSINWALNPFVEVEFTSS